MTEAPIPPPIPNPLLVEEAAGAVPRPMRIAPGAFYPSRWNRASAALAIFVGSSVGLSNAIVGAWIISEDTNQSKWHFLKRFTINSTVSFAKGFSYGMFWPFGLVSVLFRSALTMKLADPAWMAPVVVPLYLVNSRIDDPLKYSLWRFPSAWNAKFNPEQHPRPPISTEDAKTA